MNSLATFVEVAAVHMKTLVAMSESKACSKVNICAQNYMEGNELTVIRTSRVHLTMPMFPPLTCTGAEVEARSWSRNLSKSISKVNAGWPAVSTCIVAMSRHSEG